MGQNSHNSRMANVTVADAKNHFSDLLRRAEYGGERVIVERHGKPVAVIVSTDDLKRLEALEDAADVRDAQAALKEAAEHGTIPLEAVLRKHGLEHLLVRPRRPVARTAGSTAARKSKRRPAALKKHLRG
jgi:prevent-host-death family protein